jgi:FKBP12-rapamycin complex-associated protein
MMEQHRMVPSSGGMPASKKKNNPLDATETCLAQAWVLYYAVFKRINQQLPTVTSLELELCSPALHSMQNIDLCVPGSYSLIDNAGVRIRSFGHVVNVIRSKQRPRKIKILGEDGLEYVFLLKGHEDLRQDERAMQVHPLKY